MADDNNINPIHWNFQNEGTDSTHSSLTSPYQANPKGFTGFTNEGTDSTHSSLRAAGFQYILIQNTVTSVNEPENLRERVFVTERITVTESFHIADLGDTNPKNTRDGAPLTERVYITERITVKDGFLLGDSATAKPFSSGTDPTGLSEIVSTTNKQTIREPVGISERVTVTRRLTHKVGVTFTGLVHLTPAYTTRFQIISHLTNKYSTEFTGTINLLVGITATGISNPLNPSVNVDGIFIIGTGP